MAPGGLGGFRCPTRTVPFLGDEQKRSRHRRDLKNAASDDEEEEGRDFIGPSRSDAPPFSRLV